MDKFYAALRACMPVAPVRYDIRGKRVGLVIVDPVNGFCTVGAGPLAPQVPDAAIDAMVTNINDVASAFHKLGHPIWVFCDSHNADRPEPPYPPHCIKGTGHDELVEELLWLKRFAKVEVFKKDCINGYIGADNLAENAFRTWVIENAIQALVVVGICTDICVMDFVLTVLSARNHGVFTTYLPDGGTIDLGDVVVYEPACATYDLPLPAALSAGLPATVAHPRAATHHMGLYFMASRGAIIADRLHFS